MTKPFMFEKPLGMRDTLPAMYALKEKISSKVEKEMAQWGYEMVETPTMEYYETVGTASAILDHHLFKLLDKQGKTLVLRPDMTAPIARVVSSTMKQFSYPLRLSYKSFVYRAQQNDGSKPAEFEQVGVELIGDDSVSADAEVIALMISSLQRVGLSQFKVAIGHIGFVHAFLLEVVEDEKVADQLQRFLYDKNYVGYSKHVASLPISGEEKERLLSLLTLRGDYKMLEKATQMVETEKGNEALIELKQLWTALEGYGVTEYVKLDLNLVLHMSYYTGTVFEGYCDRVGMPVSSGGRYDELLDKFDRPGQATGFGMRLDLLVEALDEPLKRPEQTCILFQAQYRKEAIARAQQLRKEGLRVVMQDVASVEDVQRMAAQFSDVIYFVDGENGGA